MLSRLLFITFLVLFSILRSAPAYSDTTVYTWKDVNGTVTYTDDPENAPNDVQVKILSQYTTLDTVFEPEPTSTAAPPLPETSPQTVTQGEFAVQLVEELGLADEPTAEEAADLLNSVRISPRLGQWELNQPMSPELTSRLRMLAVAAAQRGSLTLSPEQALLAFDTASALLGLSVPVPTLPEEASESPYPIAETPPLVSVAPPPDLYPYYLWTPVAGGFWWGGVLFPGFFVLDVNHFHSHHHHHFNDHGSGLDSGHIGHHFKSRMNDHPFGRSSALSRPVRGGRSASGIRSGPASHRMFNPSTRSNAGLRSPGLRFSGAQMGRRYAAARPMSMPSAIGRRSFPTRSITSMPMVRPSAQSLPVRSNRTVFSAPRQSASTMSRGFHPGTSRGNLGRSAGRGFSRSR